MGAADSQPAILTVDNQGAKLIKNPKFHEQTKYIEVRFYFICKT